MGNYISLNEPLYQYMIGVTIRDNDVLRRLREETSTFANADFQIAPEQGAFFSVLLKAIGARRTLEIGVFTGYSALVTALALPEDGKVIACDVNEEWTSIARRYWTEAGVAHKIDLRLAPALETLDALVANPGQPFDFAFIDADKINTDPYFERCMQLIRPGGLIAVDNAFMSGNIVQIKDNASATAMDAFLKKVHADNRVDVSLVPIADGVLLVRKRE